MLMSVNAPVALNEAVVAAADWESPAVRVIHLQPAPGAAFAPSDCGAHIDIGLPSGEWRSYSLVSAPGDTQRYSVAVQRGPSHGAAWLTDELSVGQRLTVRGPHQSFALHADDGAPTLFIAGGIGITPFLAMLDTLQAQQRPWQLVYAVRSREGAAFLTRLAALGERVRVHADEEVGQFLSLPAVLDSAAPGTHVYVCGPGPMMAEARRQAELRPELCFHREQSAHSA